VAAAFVERPADTLEPYGCRPRAPTADSISRWRIVEVATAFGGPLPALVAIAVAALAVAHFRRASTQPGARASCSPAGASAAQIIHAYTLVQDKEAMNEAVANIRWLIAAGLRDF
jgi:hypothetical protein